MRSGSRQLRSLFGLVLALLLPSAAVADGTQTGVLAGDVVDAQGAPLPGVEVTAAGPQGSRTAVTGDDGGFRFPALALGTYQVAAELLGLRSTAEAEVFLARTTEVRLRLAPEEEAPIVEASESIQVVAEAPLIDRFDTRVGTSVRYEFLHKLPVQRFYQSVALALPGVAGGEDGNPNVSGALRSSNLFLVDGVDTTDPVTGLFGLNLNYEAVQEVNVSTAALPVEYGRASGAVINVVTRSGSNEYQGAARWFGANNDWNAPFDYSEEETGHLAPDLAAANSGPDDVDQTVALAAGGPVRQDRLWFFTAYEDGEASLLSPSYEGLFWDQGAATESSAVKLTWQPVPATTLVGQYTSDSSRFAVFNPFNRGPAENRIGSIPIPLRFSLVDRIPGDLFALQDQSQDGDFSKLQWNTAFSQNFSAELTVAHQERELQRQPLNSRGLTGDSPHVSVTFWDFDELGNQAIQEVILFNGITDRGFESRPRDQANLALTGFFQVGPTDHEIKAGIDVQRTESERRFNFPGTPGVDKATSRPVEGRLYFDLDPNCPGVRCAPFDTGSGTFIPWLLFNFFERPALETREDTAAAYLSDTVLFGRWLVSLGARLETVKGEERSGVRLVDDRAVSPRLAISYDAKGDGSVLFTATWGRYVEPFLQQYLDSFADLETFSGYTIYIWGDAVGVDCTGQDPLDPSSDCWFQGDREVDFFGVQPAPPNRALKASKVDELVVGFERQITETTGVSLHFVDREWNDLWDSVFREDRDEEGNPLFIAQIRNLPFARRSYQAIQLLVQKRWADNWQLLGSYTRSKAEGNLFEPGGTSTFADFAERTDANLVNRFGLAPYDRQHQVKLLGQYQVPLGRAGLSIGNVVRYESGVPYQTEAWDPYGIRFLTRRGSERLPEVFQWDLGLTLDVPLASGMGLEARAEVFNVTNERRVLGVETLRDTGLYAKPRSLLDLQAPRSYRFGLGFRF